MKCLVTGGAGFIGSNLVNFLVKQGYNVEVWDDLSTGKLEHIHEDAFFRKIDISDIDQYKSNYFNQKWDVIFHLAALPRIHRSFEEPVKTAHANIMGTQLTLEMAKESGSKFVYAGSSSFYFDPHANPYAFTKWVGEEYCKMYNQIWDVPVAITRFFNVYGHNHDRDSRYATVVAAFERCKIEDKPFVIYGDGSKRRDFTHIDDIVRGIFAASRRKWNGDIFNLGRAKNYSIKELAEMFEADKIVYKPNKPGEAQNTLADIEETCEKLQWKPTRELSLYVKAFLNRLEKGEL